MGYAIDDIPQSTWQFFPGWKTKSMQQVSIHEVQVNFSRLVEQTANGEPFVITQSGKPMLTVSAYTLSPAPALCDSFLKGRVTVPEDFNVASALVPCTT